MNQLEKYKITEQIIVFFNEIGIAVRKEEIEQDTFLPGLTIEGGVLLIDKDKLKYPGDLLHEAGHIAVTEKKERNLIGTGKVNEPWPKDGEELVAILWSYAALTHLNIAPEVVFHPDGYKKDSEWLIEQFCNKVYIGLPLFEWMGFCDEQHQFLKVKKWLR